MTNPSGADLEAVRIVLADLDYLRGSWDQDVGDDSLRRSSPILRRLLVEGDLQRAWKVLGYEKQPLVRAVSLEAELAARRLALKGVRFATAGGAIHGSLEVQAVLETGYISPSRIQEIHQLLKDHDPTPTFSLRRYLESTCIVVSGRPIDRRSLIKYVANKLGGAHFDGERAAREQDFRLLDQVRDTYVVANKPLIYFEFLSPGQALLNSSDIAQLGLVRSR